MDAFRFLGTSPTPGDRQLRDGFSPLHGLYGENRRFFRVIFFSCTKSRFLKVFNFHLKISPFSLFSLFPLYLLDFQPVSISVFHPLNLCFSLSVKRCRLISNRFPPIHGEINGSFTEIFSVSKTPETLSSVFVFDLPEPFCLHRPIKVLLR